MDTCPLVFPDPQLADPAGEGLVAIGGDLSAATLLAAYRQGIFPWFNADDPICWWSPEPRCIIEPQHFKPSKSLVRQLKKDHYTLTFNHCFTQVITACAQPRRDAHGTWISPDIVAGYCALHDAGLAYSIEVWEQQQLVGGLYGVQLGRAFFGESMFSRKSDTSKIAFCFLMQLCHASQFAWVDCQLPNPHLMSLGAITIPRAQFLQQVQRNNHFSAPNWQPLLTRRFKSSELLSSQVFFDLIESIR